VIVSSKEYIFEHMCNPIKDGIIKKKKTMPYTRLIYEIIYLGGLLQSRHVLEVDSDDDLDTCIRKVINGTCWSIWLIK